MAIKAKFALPAPAHKPSWAAAFNHIEKLIADGVIDATQGFILYFTDGKIVRSTAQNAYYWGVIIKTFSDYTGIEGKELHELFKSRYATYKMIPFVDGKRRKVRKSTTDMTKAEMSVYIEKCIAFCAEYACAIPSPDNLTDAQYMECVADGIVKPVIK